MTITSTSRLPLTLLLGALMLAVPLAQAQGNPPPGGQPHAVPAKPAGAAPKPPGAPAPAPGAHPKPPAPGPGVHAPAPVRPLPPRPAPSYRPEVRVGVYWGAPVYPWPWWDYPDPFYPYPHAPYYYPPAPLVYEPPPVYIEQPPPPQYWYYCEASKTYYPYVQTCATPWLRVVPYASQ